MLNPQNHQRNEKNNNNSNLPFYLQNKTDNNRIPKKINDNFINDGFSFEKANVDKEFNENFAVKYVNTFMRDLGVLNILNAYRGFCNGYEFCVYEADYVQGYYGKNRSGGPIIKKVVFSSVKLRKVNIPEFTFSKYSYGWTCAVLFFSLFIPHFLFIFFGIPYLIISTLLGYIRLSPEIVFKVSTGGAAVFGFFIISLIIYNLRKNYVETHVYLRKNGFEKKYTVNGLADAKLNKHKLEKIFNHLPICQKIDSLYPKYGDFECHKNCIQTVRDGNLTEKDVHNEAMKAYEYAIMFDEILTM